MTEAKEIHLLVYPDETVRDAKVLMPCVPALETALLRIEQLESALKLAGCQQLLREPPNTQGVKAQAMAALKLAGAWT